MEQRGLQRSCPPLGLLEERFEICAAVQPRWLRHQCSLSDARIPRGAQSLSGGVGLMLILRCVSEDGRKQQCDRSSTLGDICGSATAAAASAAVVARTTTMAAPVRE